MTAEERKAACEACEQATPGPWGLEDEVNAHCMVTRGLDASGAFVYIADTAYSDNEADARFIALARTALPAALADAERLARVVEILSEREPRLADLRNEVRYAKFHCDLEAWWADLRSRALAAAEGKDA